MDGGGSKGPCAASQAIALGLRAEGRVAARIAGIHGNLDPRAERVLELIHHDGGSDTRRQLLAAGGLLPADGLLPRAQPVHECVGVEGAEGGLEHGGQESKRSTSFNRLVRLHQEASCLQTIARRRSTDDPQGLALAQLDEDVVELALAQLLAGTVGDGERWSLLADLPMSADNLESSSDATLSNTKHQSEKFLPTPSKALGLESPRVSRTGSGAMGSPEMSEVDMMATHGTFNSAPLPF